MTLPKSCLIFWLFKDIGSLVKLSSIGWRFISWMMIGYGCRQWYLMIYFGILFGLFFNLSGCSEMFLRSWALWDGQLCHGQWFKSSWNFGLYTLYIILSQRPFVTDQKLRWGSPVKINLQARNDKIFIKVTYLNLLIKQFLNRCISYLLKQDRFYFFFPRQFTINHLKSYDS